MKNLHQLKPEKKSEDTWHHLVSTVNSTSNNIYWDGINIAFNNFQLSAQEVTNQFNNFRMTYRNAVLADNPVAYWRLGVTDVT